MNAKQITYAAAPMLALAMLATQSYASDPAPAQPQAPAKERVQKRDTKEERIYGSQLMTREERLEHREKLRSAKTREERQQIRKEHHAQMKERAKERGVTLPDDPPAAGQGPGQGMGGMGGGMGGGYRR